MKAWKVYINLDSWWSVILFAETRGKAIAYAKSMDEFMYCEWIDITARRFKEFDQYYKGEPEVDWYDDEMRLILVRDYGWTCDEPLNDMCDKCVAKKYCEWYEGESEDEGI